MFIPDFSLHRPEKLEEACRILEESPDGVLLAGGTDLLLDLKQGKRHHQDVISLTRIAELQSIRVENDKLVLGAGVTHNQLVESPVVREKWLALSEAAEQIGTEQIRNTATVGGNLCTAASCADTAPILVALRAEVEISNSRGKRALPLETFFTGHRTTALKKGDILSRIRVPVPSLGAGACYKKFGLRGAANISVASVAAMVHLKDGVCRDARFVMGAVAPTPKVANKAGALVKGKRVSELSDDAFLDQLGRAVSEEAEPIDDIRGSGAYRLEVTGVQARRSFTVALERAEANVEKEGQSLFS
jgi:CO/xanthine dehydrogenase FAD-binding subunit